MDEFIGWLWNLSFWHWFGLGGLFFAFEVSLPTTVLIFPAVSAILIRGLLTVFPDLDWRLQGLFFALLSLASAIGWRWWFRTRERPVDHPNLYVRGAQLVGRKIVLEEDLRFGRGPVQIDDAMWLAVSADGTAIAAGNTVEVTQLVGTTLAARPIPQHKNDIDS